MITLATWLTIGRIALIVPIVLFVLGGHPLAAAVCVGLAGATDFLDGYIARRREEVSALGTALDPIADKIVLAASFVAVLAAGNGSAFQTLAIVAILSRELLVSGLREATAGDVALPVTVLAKVKTASQFVAAVALLVIGGTVANVTLAIATTLTLWTGADYLRAWMAATRS